MLIGNTRAVKRTAEHNRKIGEARRARTPQEIKISVGMLMAVDEAIRAAEKNWDVIWRRGRDYVAVCGFGALRNEYQFKTAPLAQAFVRHKCLEAGLKLLGVKVEPLP